MDDVLPDHPGDPVADRRLRLLDRVCLHPLLRLGGDHRHGPLPAWLYNFNSGVIRYFVRTNAWVYLQTDAWPPFGLADDPSYPIRVKIAPAAERQSRLKALFRLILALPMLIVLYAVNYMHLWVAAIAWLTIVFRGYLPEGVNNALTFVNGFYARLYGYVAFLTDDYPPIGIEAAEPSIAAAPPAPPPAAGAARPGRVGDGPMTEAAEQGVEKGDGYAVAHLDDLGEGPGFRKIRKELGVTAFGVNAIVLPPAYETGRHYHDEQEELYFLHSGRIEMEFGDGSTHELAPGGLAWVDAATVRKVRNLSDSEEAVYVVVGGKDGYVGRDGKLPEGEVSRFGDNAPPGA